MVSGQNGTQTAAELETFLPQSVAVKVVDGSDLAAGKFVKDDKETWDPFKQRKVAAPTTDCDTLTHLLKASLGTGILAMPDAFRNSGIYLGIFFTIFVAFICTYCAYILVECAHVLYVRTRTSTMSFAEVAEAAFKAGPKPLRKYGNAAKMFILFNLFLTYFGTCAVYTVIIGKNFAQVIDHYNNPENDPDQQINQSWIIGGLLIPLVLLSWVPNLKKLAPISMVANLFMGVGLGITFYYLVMDLPSLSDVPAVADPFNWPIFFSITIFAMEAIGVVMPLENNMSTPTHFVGICGVLNKGMGGVTLIYIFLGFMGYYRFGDAVQGSITLNLDVKEIPAQIVKILVGLAVYCTYGLQFYVCLEIGWDAIKDRFTKHKMLAEYALRTTLVTLSVVLAIAVPTISPFIGLIGAFCFSILGLICPCVIETITFWDSGLGRYNWVMWKNVILSLFGVAALVFGTWTSVTDIIKALGGDVTTTNNTLASNFTLASNSTLS